MMFLLGALALNACALTDSQTKSLQPTATPTVQVTVESTSMIEVERTFLGPLNLEYTFMSEGEPLPARFTAAHPWVDVDQDGDLDDLAGKPFTWKVTLSHPVIFTTPRDLVIWVKALYHDRSVLAPASLKEMMTYPTTNFDDPEDRNL